MKKLLTLCLVIICSGLNVFPQSTSVTNNNTITIQGNVYYFKPATTPSSPQPKVGSSDFIGTGSWYGEDAAKAWASIADWAIEHCILADPSVKGRNGERVYISSVHAYLKGTSDGRKYASSLNNGGWSPGSDDARYNGITIYYWIVSANTQMEDGRREYRSFRF